jgi:hypothetical protein
MNEVTLMSETSTRNIFHYRCALGDNSFDVGRRSRAETSERRPFGLGPSFTPATHHVVGVNVSPSTFGALLRLQPPDGVPMRQPRR